MCRRAFLKGWLEIWHREVVQLRRLVLACSRWLERCLPILRFNRHDLMQHWNYGDRVRPHRAFRDTDIGCVRRDSNYIGTPHCLVHSYRELSSNQFEVALIYKQTLVCYLYRAWWFHWSSYRFNDSGARRRVLSHLWVFRFKQLSLVDTEVRNNQSHRKVINYQSHG